MADHLHTQIREALATTLTGLSTTGSHVFANRLAALPESSLPALRISLDDETVEALTLHANPVLDRRLVAIVEACVLADDDTQDATAEQIQKEVEVALASGISISGGHLYVRYTGSQYDDAAGGQYAAVRRMSFEIVFFTQANAPDALS